jgi:hydrogen peroxide-dependent heme synthase
VDIVFFSRCADPGLGCVVVRLRVGAVDGSYARRGDPVAHRLQLGGWVPMTGSAGHNGGMSEEASQSNASRIREINDSIRYTMWSVFRLETPIGEADRDAEAAEVEKLLAELAETDTVVRGLYDVSGLRADADVMVWAHAATSEELQSAYHRFRRTAFGARLAPVWSQMALHRPAEFNRSHVPAFLADEEAKAHVCVYPFVRSYEWYLLEESERRALLAEHGQMARDYKDVRANTVASFALGDYEWILAFECDELHRIVDLMRHLRASGARRHVREEIPFYTGALTSARELVDRLP